MITIVRTLILALLISSCSGGEPPRMAQSAVAMPDSYSAETSAGILYAGGNAVDAAIAAAFSLAVTLPEAGNIGGGGFMLVYFDDEADFVDYRETAPLQSGRDMYLDEDGNVIARSSLIGHRAAGVPGTVAGMWLAHQRYGSIPWEELLQPAISLARNGFLVPQSLADTARETIEWHAGEIDFASNFGDLRAGEIFRQEDLAETLERIAANGADEFYRGTTADHIVDEMQRGGGLISAADLDQYEAVIRKPLRANWRDLEILSAPPPSSGGFAVVQLLKIKDYLDHLFVGVDHNSAEYIHLVAEMEKRVFADRAEYLGDPDFVDMPIDEILSEEYLRKRAGEINTTQISDIEAVPPGLESFDTTHFSIVDQYGNAVANSYTLNWDFGSGVVVSGAGFLLNDEMDDFSVKPGVPNIYGVVGSTANEIQPGKRMLSSMSPTILLRDGEVELVVGTPGGSTIFTTVFQTIINIYDFDMEPFDAIGTTRFHHQLLPPDLVTYSPSVPLSSDTISALDEFGYRAVPHSYRYGDVQVILRENDELKAASDPRKRGESRILMWGR